MSNDTDEIIELSYGKFYILPNAENDWVIKTIKSGQVWEPEVMSFCEQYVKPNSIVIDIGANIGTFSVRFGQLVGMDGMVFAFEPQERTFNYLMKNIKLNQLNNVFGLKLGLGSEISFGFIEENKHRPGEAKIINSEHKNVMIYPLDTFDFNNVSLIKVDVERYEAHVFKGAIETIKRNRPCICFEVTTIPYSDFPHDYVFTLLDSLDYKIGSLKVETGDYYAIPKELL